jgi:hypothetical protein
MVVMQPVDDAIRAHRDAGDRPARRPIASFSQRVWNNR